MKLWLSILLFCFVSSLSCYSQYRDTTIAEYVKIDSIGDFNPFGTYDCYQVLRTYSKKGELKKEVYDNWNGNRAWVNYFGKKKIVRRKYKGRWARSQMLPCFEDLILVSVPSPVIGDTIYDVLDVSQFKYFYVIDSNRRFEHPIPYLTKDLALEDLGIQSLGEKSYHCSLYDYDYSGVADCADTAYLNYYSSTPDLLYGNTLTLLSFKGETNFVGMGFSNDSSYVSFGGLVLNNQTTLTEIETLFPNSYRQKKDYAKRKNREDVIVLEFHPHTSDYYFKKHYQEDNNYDWERIWNVNWVLVFKGKHLISIRYQFGT